MDYNDPTNSGRLAFRAGFGRNENPVPFRTEANARLMWYRGWDSESRECSGIEIEKGVYSGCDQSAGDCPACGK